MATRKLKNGEPCEHRGCLDHVSHPCEGCGRIGGRSAFAPSELEQARKLRAYIAAHPGVTDYELTHAGFVEDLYDSLTILEHHRLIRRERVDGNGEDRSFAIGMEVPS